MVFSSGTVVRELLDELNAEMESAGVSGPVEVVLVGGALLLILEIRDNTYDIDLFLHTVGKKVDITKCIHQIAKRRQLPADWANFDVENLDVDISRLLTVPLYKMSILNVLSVNALSLLALKVIAALNREARDEEDIAQIRKLNPNITFEEVFKHMLEICPTQYMDEEFARDIFDPVSW